jgi:hypothetical protein
VNMLIGEVLNGGFHQYFYNSSGTNHQEIETSLRTIGAEEEANLLIQARQMFRLVIYETTTPKAESPTYFLDK